MEYWETKHTETKPSEPVSYVAENCSEDMNVLDTFSIVWENLCSERCSDVCVVCVLLELAKVGTVQNRWFVAGPFADPSARPTTLCYRHAGQRFWGVGNSYIGAWRNSATLGMQEEVKILRSCLGIFWDTLRMLPESILTKFRKRGGLACSQLPSVAACFAGAKARRWRVVPCLRAAPKRVACSWRQDDVIWRLYHSIYMCIYTYRYSM